MHKTFGLVGYLVLAGSLVLTGCEGGGTPAAPADSLTAEPSPRLNTVSAGKAKDMLAQRLTARLVEVTSGDGPVAAIQVCRTEANEIARQVGDELGVRIGRTSQRLRNSANQAPEWAVELLHNEPNGVQAVRLEDGSTAALFPILLQPQCVMCHGGPDDIPDEIEAALAEGYPDDQATGFEVGELRGWFWVEVPAKG